MRTDGHDEANSRFSQFANAPKKRDNHETTVVGCDITAETKNAVL
jgi:hypothetical protein